jgi:flagellar biosynthetic protein FliQ
MISGPLVVLAASLGLIVGILQAATQVQEQTLGSAVKIIGLFVALIISGFFIFQYLQKFAYKSISRAFQLVPQLESHPLPRSNYFGSPDSSKRKVSGQPQNIVDQPLKKASPQDPSKLSIDDGLNSPDQTGVTTRPNENLRRPDNQVRPAPPAIETEPIERQPREQQRAARPAPPPPPPEAAPIEVIRPEAAAPDAGESRFSNIIDRIRERAEQN